MSRSVIILGDSSSGCKELVLLQLLAPSLAPQTEIHTLTQQRPDEVLTVGTDLMGEEKPCIM